MESLSERWWTSCYLREYVPPWVLSTTWWSRRRQDQDQPMVISQTQDQTCALCGASFSQSWVPMAHPQSRQWYLVWTDVIEAQQLLLGLRRYEICLGNWKWWKRDDMEILCNCHSSTRRTWRWRRCWKAWRLEKTKGNLCEDNGITGKGRLYYGIAGEGQEDADYAKSGGEVGRRRPCRRCISV